jgi:hypothetical protein
VAVSQNPDRGATDCLSQLWLYEWVAMIEAQKFAFTPMKSLQSSSCLLSSLKRIWWPPGSVISRDYIPPSVRPNKLTSSERTFCKMFLTHSRHFLIVLDSFRAIHLSTTPCERLVHISQADLEHTRALPCCGPTLDSLQYQRCFNATHKHLPGPAVSQELVSCSSYLTSHHRQHASNPSY